MITAERLRELFSYDPETGAFTRLVSTGDKVKIGDIAGCINGAGYWQISIDYKLYLLHRLAVLWMTGRWPIAQVDHVDLERSNNSWVNLREATSTQNHANLPRSRANTSGWKGVYWRKNEKKWAAMIQHNYVRRHLGLFNCPAAAHLVYVIEANKAFGQFSRAS